MYSNELKNLVILDTTQKYDKINKKILKSSKIYFNIVNNSSLETISSEKNNNYSFLGDIKIKELLENQHNLIKELVNIINTILIENINNEVIKRYEDESSDSLEEKQKNIITNKNLNMLSKSNNENKSKSNKNKSENKKERKNIAKNNKNNNIKKNENNNLISKKLVRQKDIIPLNVIFPKTNNEYNGALSFFKINSNQKIEFNPNKSMNKIFYYETSNNPKKKDNNFPTLGHINVNNNSYYKNNYTIDEERNDTAINERQTSITSNHILDDDIGLSPEKLNSKKQKKNNNVNKNFFENERNYTNNISYKKSPMKGIYYVRSVPNIFLKNLSGKKEGFSNEKRNNTSFNFLKKKNILSSNKNSYVINKIRKNVLFSVPYINNGKINSPSRQTKKLLSSSYKKINRYNNLINSNINE